MKNCIQHIVFFCIGFTCVNTLAMSENTITIIDANKNQNLNSIVDNGCKFLGIFGATPSYNQFVVYGQKIESDYTALQNMISNNQSVKNVVGKKVAKKLRMMQQDLVKLEQLFESEDGLF